MSKKNTTIALSLFGAMMISPAFATPSKPVDSLPQLHTNGNKILDSRGNQVRLCGVNCACMEWSYDGEGHILDTLKVAIHDWHSNFVRIPLSQERWFGLGPDQKGKDEKGAAYQALVHSVVDYCATNRCYV